MDATSDELRRAAVEACRAPGVLRAHFQPIVDLARGVVCGYEALARFDGPPRASPDGWFAAAHEAGVGEVLEARAIAVALAARPALPSNCFLTVNVGPVALQSAPVADVLRAAGDLRGVFLEITEQSAVEDYDELLAVLAPLRRAGALIAVDDVGAGFSSLKHITAIRPDLIKVDRGLVTGIDEDEAKAAVVETLGFFASRLDAWLLAEGVETLPELDRLLSLRVPLGQGFALGRPTPAMGPVGFDAGALCRVRAELAGHGELHGLAQAVPAVAAGAPETVVTDAFLRHAGSWVALVDEFDRPVSLVPRGVGIRRRRGVAPLRVTHHERLGDVVRRIVTRPADERMAPIALCDEASRLVGLIPVERLFERLADVADGGVAGAGARDAARSA